MCEIKCWTIRDVKQATSANDLNQIKELIENNGIKTFSCCFYSSALHHFLQQHFFLIFFTLKNKLFPSWKTMILISVWNVILWGWSMPGRRRSTTSTNQQDCQAAVGFCPRGSLRQHHGTRLFYLPLPHWHFFTSILCPNWRTQFWEGFLLSSPIFLTLKKKAIGTF